MVPETARDGFCIFGSKSVAQKAPGSTFLPPAKSAPVRRIAVQIATACELCGLSRNEELVVCGPDVPDGRRQPFQGWLKLCFQLINRVRGSRRAKPESCGEHRASLGGKRPLIMKMRLRAAFQPVGLDEEFYEFQERAPSAVQLNREGACSHRRSRIGQHPAPRAIRNFPQPPQQATGNRPYCTSRSRAVGCRLPNSQTTAGILGLRRLFAPTRDERAAQASLPFRPEGQRNRMRVATAVSPFVGFEKSPNMQLDVCSQPNCTREKCASHSLCGRPRAIRETFPLSLAGTGSFHR
jgi:hypothetical protein